jgi:hypothetical protein
MIFLTNLGSNDVRFLEINHAVLEKILSDVTDVAGILKCILDKFARRGNSFSLSYF